MGGDTEALYQFRLPSSVVCRHEHFHEDWFERWAKAIEPNWSYELKHHRKLWEWCAIIQALHERKKLTEGSRGLGFAVGTEPLSSLFASLGATIEATDLFVGEEADHWTGTNQHASGLDALYKDYLLNRDLFQRKVSFHPADMRDLSSFTPDSYDFIWSSCSFEHLGNLTLGINFVEESSKLLRKGGVAVHTTEFNCLSDEVTIDNAVDVIYRGQDLRRLKKALEENGFDVAPLDLRLGDDDEDRLFDYPPYGMNNRDHIKLYMQGFVATSVLLIITKI